MDVATEGTTDATVGAEVPSPNRRRWGLLLSLVAAIAMGAWGPMRDIVDAEDGSSPPKVLVGPYFLSDGGFLQLERHTETIGPLPRLRIVVRSSRGGSDADCDTTLDAFTKTLARRRPFTVVWDVRRVTIPRISRAQFNAARAWIGEHVVAWDTHAQAHVVVLTNPLVRGILRLMLHIFRPPQPVHVAKDDRAALEFTRTCCHVVRSYVKASYEDREERHKLFG